MRDRGAPHGRPRRLRRTATRPALPSARPASAGGREYRDRLGYTASGGGPQADAPLSRRAAASRGGDGPDHGQRRACQPLAQGGAWQGVIRALDATRRQVDFSWSCWRLGAAVASRRAHRSAGAGGHAVAAAAGRSMPRGRRSFTHATVGRRLWDPGDSRPRARTATLGYCRSGGLGAGRPWRGPVARLRARGDGSSSE